MEQVLRHYCRRHCSRLNFLAKFIWWFCRIKKDSFFYHNLRGNYLLSNIRRNCFEISFWQCESNYSTSFLLFSLLLLSNSVWCKWYLLRHRRGKPLQFSHVYAESTIYIFVHLVDSVTKVVNPTALLFSKSLRDFFIIVLDCPGLVQIPISCQTNPR